MKGQISLIEAIVASIALFIAFNMMITVGEHQTKWKEALNSLYGRDALITADRLGKLHDYSFSQAFKTEFLNKIDAIKDTVVKYETQGTLKSQVYIACDCTADQVTYLQNILNDVKFNTRGLTAVVCSTALPTINTCGTSTKYPNALVVWGYKDMTPYVSILTDFISDGSGILEIADIQNSAVDGQGSDDEGQKQIFGLKSIDAGNFPSNQDGFLKPRDASQLPYQSYKWFYHLPHLLRGTSTASVPTEDGIAACTSPTITTGNFKFQDINYAFWICGTTSVYWDTNGNNIADKVVTPRNKFSISTSDFLLNYIDSTDKIRISFKSDYKFNDFIVKAEAFNKLAPIDDNKNKVLLSMGFWDLEREKPIAGAIFNSIGNGKAVWMADFARVQLGNSGDDHKQLLASLIFSISNKKTKETPQQVGQITSYINVNNTDMLEIYKVDLSIGKPF